MGRNLVAVKRHPIEKLEMMLILVLVRDSLTTRWRFVRIIVNLQALCCFGIWQIISMIIQVGRGTFFVWK